MLTRRTKYALRTLVLLAREAPEARLSTAEMAEKENMPRKFLEKILLELQQNGYLSSAKGRNGGYSLIKPAASIHVSEIVRLFDGPLALVPCASVTAYRPCPDCGNEASCCIRSVMRAARDAVSAVLEKYTIADMATQNTGELQ